MDNHTDLEKVLPEILRDDNLWILNVQIDPTAGRKQQEFSWLTRGNDKEEGAGAEEVPKAKL